MAGETINVNGAYASAIASASIATTAYSLQSSTVVASVLAAEKDYPLLDFKLSVTAGTVTAGDTINLYRRKGDGTDQSPIITGAGGAEGQYLGSFELATNLETQFITGEVNSDNNDTFYLENTGAAAITCELFLRTRSYNSAV